MKATIFKIKNSDYFGLKFRYDEVIIELLKEYDFIWYDHENKCNSFDPCYLEEVVDFCRKHFNYLNGVKNNDHSLTSIDGSLYAALNLCPGASDELLELGYKIALEKNANDEFALDMIKKSYIKIQNLR